VLGDHPAAENAYREASRLGREPQPGLALLRLAQGRLDAAHASVRRMMAESTSSGSRAGLLSACVEVMLAAGHVEEARAACADLEELAAQDDGGALSALAAHARATVDLDRGDARAALAAARRAADAWRELAAPYDLARARVLLALACRELGDQDAAALELEAARAAFEELGAQPDAARAAKLAAGDGGAARHGLSAREVEVLRRLAAGETNKAIAAELVLSVRTVDRHVSNIFAKLGVSSRAAATAYAHEHDVL
jgi:DNA-binding NarL/FixJ family response regulator